MTSYSRLLEDVPMPRALVKRPSDRLVAAECAINAEKEDMWDRGQGGSGVNGVLPR